MAQKKSTNKKVTSKNNTDTKKSSENNLTTESGTSSNNRVASLVLLAFGVIFTLIAIFPGASAWNLLHSTLVGLFSWCAYAVGPLLVYSAVLVERDRENIKFKASVVSTFILIFMLCGLTQAVWGSPLEKLSFFEIVERLFIDGKLFKGGGLSAIVFGVPLTMLLGGFGGSVVMVIVTLVVIMFLTNTTVRDLFEYFKVFKNLFRRMKKPKIPLSELEASDVDNIEEDTQLLREIYAYTPPENFQVQPTLSENVPVKTSAGFKGAYEIMTGRSVAVPKRELENPTRFNKIYDIDNDTKVLPVKNDKKSLSKIDIPTHIQPQPLERGVLQPKASLGKFAITYTEKSQDDKDVKQPIPLSAIDEKNSMSIQDSKSIDFLINRAVSSDTDSVAKANLEEKTSNLSQKHTNIYSAIEDVDKTTKATEVYSENSIQQTGYKYPPTELLNEPQTLPQGDTTKELRANAERLVNTLRSFGVETRIIDISRGPAVTRYELQPSVGVKISKITNLVDDIALNLAAGEVRLEAPIPNKAAVGIEVPNKVISSVPIRELLESKEFINSQSKLTVALGKDITGNACLADLSKMPHILIAGATGSGKSVCINSLIISILYKASPTEVRLIMIDPKVVELGNYNGIPHLLSPVVNDPKKAAGALCTMVAEMLKRYKLFADCGVRDLAGYNKLAETKEELEKLPQIVIIIDELADLMMAAPKEVEDSICRLAQMARAAGMYLVIATQRPSVDVITGIIKANIPSRISFAVSSQIDSRTILDSSGAEKLLGKGDMLFSPVGSNKPTRVQGCFVTDAEVEGVVSFVKANSAVCYDEGFINKMESSANELIQKGQKNSAKKLELDSEDEDDSLIDEAIAAVVESGQSSTSYLQRKLKIGYARAARLIDQMERRGIVGPYEGNKPRQILVSRGYNSEDS